MFEECSNDIKLIILSYCDICTLGKVAQYNKNWDKISKNDILWKPLGFLHRPINSKEHLKEYVKEQHRLSTLIFPELKIYHYSNKFLNLVDIKLRVKVPDISSTDAFEKAIKLINKGEYGKSLIAFRYVTKLDDPDIFGIIADSFYYTNQKDNAIHYYKLYYKNATKFIINRIVDCTGYNNIKHLEFLLNCGAYVDQVDNKFGSTALMFATQKGYSKIVKLLLDHGASLEARSVCNNYTPFDFSLEKIDLNTMNILLDHGIDVNTRHSKYGSTALMFACQQGNFNVLKLLLKRGANINLKSLVNNYTAYDYALENLNLNIISTLLDCGFDVNTRHTKYGSTALMFAAQQGKIDIVDFLLNRGADLKLKSYTGLTAFDFSHKSMIQLKYQ